MKTRRIILKCFLSPGDIVMLTGAVRELHRCHPGEFLTDVLTSCPALWEHNPYLTPLDENARGVEVVECHYPLIHLSNHAPYQFIHGFTQFLNERLGTRIQPALFKGDIHLTDEERSWEGLWGELGGTDSTPSPFSRGKSGTGWNPSLPRGFPFWIIVAGGKRDMTIKWWHPRRYQAVVDHFRGKIQFVQVGEAGHHHPPLRGVIDLRERTSLRQLVRLVYHAQGVVCPVTNLMHLAAAIPLCPVQGSKFKVQSSPLACGRPTMNFEHGTLNSFPQSRPCVVIAGGREPSQWEAYPHHQFIHTNGALRCCDNGGCWKARTVPLHDGDERDHPRNLCLDVVRGLPRCMDLIRAEDVIRRMEMYFEGGAARYLRRGEARAGARAVEVTRWKNGMPEEYRLQRQAAEAWLKAMPRYPGGFHGRGIVICGGGEKYFTCAWVCINVLRQQGCRLPIQLWHLGPAEMNPRWAALVRPLGVECVDALEVRQRHPARILNGYEVKPYALLHCPFREVLLLDADNVPLRDPEFLFDTEEFRETGAIFWPDYGRLGRERAIWKICGVAYRDEPEFESGQIVVDKQRCWKALNLAMWFNEHSDFYYHHIHGDKDTFHLAWRKLRQPYAMPARGIETLEGTMCQHDFTGARLFQHRNGRKWQVSGRNARVRGFRLEEDCRRHLRRLRRKLD